MRQKATCSTHIRTEEEDTNEQEADLAKDKADEVRPTKTTPNFGRKTEAIEDQTYENYSQFWPQDGSHRGTFARRGSFHSGLSRQYAIECGYCGKIGHHEEECRKKKRESAFTSWQLMNYARNKKNVVRFHGLPDDVTSYRGPQLVSCVWRRLLQTRGKIVNLSSSYHPQTDGQIEWVSKILEQYLRCSHNYQQDDGIDLLPLAKFTYNNSLHGSTRVIPFFANYGFHHRLGTSIPGNTVNPSAEARAHTLVDIPQNLSLELILAGDQYTAQPCPSLQLVIKFGSYVVISTLLDLEESWTTRSWALSTSLSISTSSLFEIHNFLPISRFIISSMPLSLTFIIHHPFLVDQAFHKSGVWGWQDSVHWTLFMHHHQYPQKPGQHLRRRPEWEDNVMDMTTIMSIFKLLTVCIIIKCYVLTNTPNTQSYYIYFSIILVDYLFHVLGVFSSFKKALEARTF